MSFILQLVVGVTILMVNNSFAKFLILEEGILRNADELTDLTFDLEMNEPWELTDHKMFQHYKNVETLRVHGPFKGSAEYKNEKMTKLLSEELFNLPKLKNLYLRRWILGDSNHMWKFPNQIQTLSLYECDTPQLDLSSYSDLIELNLQYNHLKQVPKFSSPLPPLYDVLILDYAGFKPSEDDFMKLCRLEKLHVCQIGSKICMKNSIVQVEHETSQGVWDFFSVYFGKKISFQAIFSF